MRIRWAQGEHADPQHVAFDGECKSTFDSGGTLVSFACGKIGKTPLAGASYKREPATRNTCDVGTQSAATNFVCTAGCDAAAPKILEGIYACSGGE